MAVIAVNLKDYLFQNRKYPGVEAYLIEQKTSLDYSVVATESAQAEKPTTPPEQVPATKPVENGSVAAVSQNLKVYLGFALEPISFSRISQVENQIGRKFDLLMGYIQWGNSANSILSSSYLNNFTANGKTPIISWEPWVPGDGAEQPNYRLANISGGNFDNYIRDFAVQMRNFGKPIFLRFAHEMNGNWYPWGGTANGNSPADYRKAWIHVHSLFQQEGATNVTWVWSPDATSYPNFNGNDLGDYYPGGDYVDWVGLDGYNWGSTKPGKTWESFESIFSSGYKKVLGYKKPIMIAETASTEVGGNKGSWFEEALTEQLPTSFPAVKAVVWFNINKETSWDIASSENSISSFRKSVSTEMYTAPLRLSGSKVISP